MRLLTFTSWIFPETHFSTSFKTISVYLAGKQVELAPVHCELCEIHSFHQDVKSTDQQNKCQNCILWKFFSKMIHILQVPGHTKYGCPYQVCSC